MSWSDDNLLTIFSLSKMFVLPRQLTANKNGIDNEKKLGLFKRTSLYFHSIVSFVSTEVDSSLSILFKSVVFVYWLRVFKVNSVLI